jgi:ribonuclease HII
MDTSRRFLVGIDEAGRGPLAGPVALGVVACFSSSYIEAFKDIKDSKKMTLKQRLFWYEKMCEWRDARRLDFKVTFSSNLVIDQIGIRKAIKNALQKGLRKISQLPKNANIYLDGSLYAPQEYTHQKTIIRGDEKISIISMASVVAKVERDRKMEGFSKNFPQYNFEQHKGYGTVLHRKMIAKHGLCEIHRKTFLGSRTS